jgi:hypothetical protein
MIQQYFGILQELIVVFAIAFEARIIGVPGYSWIYGHPVA